MTTTSTRTAQVIRALRRIVELCGVDAAQVDAREATAWFETARGATPVRVIAAQVTFGDHVDAAFLAVVLRLPPTTPDLSLLDVDAPMAASDGAHWCTECPRWQGWLVGDHPHTPLSVTVGCGARTEDGPPPGRAKGRASRRRHGTGRAGQSEPLARRLHGDSGNQNLTMGGT